MDLLDALCSNIQSPSVVQLSLNPLFRRGYSALYKALGGNLFAKPSEDDESQSKGKQFQSLDLISQVVPIPKQRHFFLFVLDCTSISRPFADTLKDRGMVHQPTPIQGNKPITIGHSYSMLAVLPERNDGDSPWTIPLDMSRVPTESNGTQMGIAQLNTVLSHPNVPWSDALCVAVVDSAYGNKKFLAACRRDDFRPHQNMQSSEIKC